MKSSSAKIQNKLINLSNNSPLVPDRQQSKLINLIKGKRIKRARIRMDLANNLYRNFPESKIVRLEIERAKHNMNMNPS